MLSNPCVDAALPEHYSDVNSLLFDLVLQIVQMAEYTQKTGSCFFVNKNANQKIVNLQAHYTTITCI